MTDEERQRAMDFIVEQQLKFSVDIEQLNESYRKAEGRFDRDERILKLMIRAGRRVRREMRERHKQFMDEMQVMKEFQAHSDRRLDALIDIVRADRNGPAS
jgi:predicted transcriptional regulator